MGSLVEGYSYDIFISYRQKDNKHDGWVTSFVENLKGELESTFKEEVSIYFDINPHDGLLETHDVDASLKEKLKCLVFIPVISRTYCDPKSFAWEHEFMAFVKEASTDKIGLKVKLPNGNVASRILPVRIHELDPSDIKQCEDLIAGHLRGVEFIYKEPGVNKPLKPEDDEKKNLNRIRYSIQINKTANAIKEIINGVLEGQAITSLKENTQWLPWEESGKDRKRRDRTIASKRRKIISGVATAVIIMFLGILYLFPGLFRQNAIEKLSGSNEVSLAVMPFQNLTNDRDWDLWQNQTKKILTAGLTNQFFSSPEVKVRNEGSVSTLIGEKTSLTTLSAAFLGDVSRKLDADIYISGSILKTGRQLRLDAELVDTRTGTNLNTFTAIGPFEQENMLMLIDSIRKKVTGFMLLSKLIKKDPGLQHASTLPKSFEAFQCLQKGYAAWEAQQDPRDPTESIRWFKKALAIDSTFYWASFDLEHWYIYFRNCPSCTDSSRMWLVRNYKRRDRMSDVDRVYAAWAYNFTFGSLEEQIKCLNQLKAMDDQSPDNYYLLGLTYNMTGQYAKAIPELEKQFDIIRRWGKKYLKGNPAYIWLSQSYIGAKQFKDARRLYREAKKYVPPEWYYMFRSELALAQKDTSKASLYISEYKKALHAVSKSECEILNGIARIYEQSGFIDKAEESYRNAYALDPVIIRKSYMDFLMKNNRNLPLALQLIEECMQSSTGSPYYDLMSMKGYCLFKQGRVHEGLDIIQKAWDDSPYKIYSIKKCLDEVQKAAGRT